MRTFSWGFWNRDIRNEQIIGTKLTVDVFELKTLTSLLRNKHRTF